MKPKGSDFLSIFKKVDVNYLDIMGHGAYAVLCYLLYIKREEGRSSTTTAELMNRLNMDFSSLKEAVSIFKTLNLIKFDKSDDGIIAFKIMLRESIPLNEKKVYVELLHNAGLVSQDRRNYLIDYLDKKHIDNGRKVNIITKDDSVKDIDLTQLRVKADPRPDTGEGLVNFYYKHLSEKFKCPAYTSNIEREAHMLKLAMKKFGDDFDTTRKILLRIIEKYSRTGEFEKACTLFRYHSERNSAYFDVFGVKQDKFVKEFKPDQEYMISNCKNIYKYFKDKGEDDEFIFEKRIKPTLSDMSEEEISQIKQTLQQV